MIVKPTNTGVGKKKNLTGYVDFRYESTLRLTFNEPVHDEIDDRLIKLLKPVSDGEIELDWRDSSEIEIHNINQKKFYQMYNRDFISLI